MPPIRAAWRNLRMLTTDPGRVVHLLVANATAQLLYALALGATVRAFGGELTIAELLVVNTAVSLFSGLAPVPGGIGIAEAGLTAGLVAFGVPKAEAITTAASYRVMTCYLPPIGGFAALRWLGRHGYV
jgi:uncharacterized membrane protein YbhN (UPF0104 family)